MLTTYAVSFNLTSAVYGIVVIVYVLSYCRRRSVPQESSSVASVSDAHARPTNTFAIATILWVLESRDYYSTSKVLESGIASGV